MIGKRTRSLVSASLLTNNPCTACSQLNASQTLVSPERSTRHLYPEHSPQQAIVQLQRDQPDKWIVDFQLNGGQYERHQAKQWKSPQAHGNQPIAVDDVS